MSEGMKLLPVQLPDIPCTLCMQNSSVSLHNSIFFFFFFTYYTVFNLSVVQNKKVISVTHFELYFLILNLHTLPPSQTTSRFPTFSFMNTCLVVMGCPAKLYYWYIVDAMYAIVYLYFNHS